MFSIQRCIIFLAVTLTGFTALVYEVIWQKQLANIIGSQARSAAIILAVFLGSLSLGYSLFGAVSRQRSMRWLVTACGLAEGGIGIWALICPSLITLLSTWASNFSPELPFIFVIDLGICFALVGLPATLMGCTLPLLTQGISRTLGEASSTHAKIYALNTVGAFLGCLCAGFYLLPCYGLVISLQMMGLVNIIAASFLVLAGCLNEPETSITKPAIENISTTLAPNCPRLIAFLAGFSAIALQTVLMRLVGLSIGSSEYTFSMVVAVYVALLAFGAWFVGGRSAPLLPLWGNQLIAAFGLVIALATIYYWPYLGHVLRSLFVFELPGFYFYHALIFVVLLMLLAIPIGCMGSTMPLLFDATKGTKDGLGSNVGKLYAANALGCVFGAILGGYLLLYWINLEQVFKLVLLLITISFVLSIPKEYFHRALMSISLSGFALVLAFFAIKLGWDVKIFAHGTFRIQSANEFSYKGAAEFYKWFTEGDRLAAYKDGPNTTVAVSEYGEGQNLSRSILINGKSDGSTAGGDRYTTELLAHYSALLTQGNTGRFGVIGFGTGITAGSLSLHPHVKSIELYEIASTVKDFSALFDFANHAITKSDKLAWHIGDAYRILGASSNLFDAIISEPSNPWVAGVEQLYSLEFLNRARSKLAKGGVYAQWFHSYSMGLDTLGMILKTFAAAFPTVRIFSIGSDIILLGSETNITQKELKLAQSRYDSNAELRSDLEKIEIMAFADLLYYEVPFSGHAFVNEPLHNLSHPRLSYKAGRDFFLNLEVKLDPYLLRARNRSWVNAKYPDSLLEQYIAPLPKTDQAIDPLIKRACNRDTPFFFKGWENSARFCRILLLKGWSYGLNIDPDGAATDELAKLSDLKESKDACLPAHNADEGLKYVMLFGRRYLPGLGIDADRLMCKAAACFVERSDKAIECRIRLIEALAFTGRIDSAQTQLEAYKKDVGSFPSDLSSEDDLKTLIEIAMQAYSEKSQIEDD